MNTSTTPSIVAGRVTADDVTRALRALVPDTHRALLFGSRATGRARDRSDWDIGIVGSTPRDGAMLERIREALDRLPTLRIFEVVDLSTAPPELRTRALREGVRLA